MTTDKPQTEDESHEVKGLTEGIARTRSEMSAKIDALEHRISPAKLGEEAKVELDRLEARVKDAVKEGLHEAKDVLHEQIEDAKGAVKDQLHEAKNMIAQGLSEARETVKKDIQTAIVHTKESIREATVGRVEILATQAGDAMNKTRDTLIDTVRQNPLPAALAGIGVAWLLMNRSSSSRARAAGLEGHEPSHGWGSGIGHAFERAEHAAGAMAGQMAHRAGDAVHGIGSAMGGASGAVSGAAHDASDAVRSALGHGMDAAGQLAHQAGDIAVHGAQNARTQAMRVERGLEATIQSNPLALGAVALVAGAAVGYSLPRTHREDELMGGVRDRLLEGASGMAHEAAQSLQHLTGAAGDSAKKALVAATK